MAAIGKVLADVGLPAALDAAAIPGAFAERIRDAIAAGEITLQFQPQADAVTLGLTGFEALARWRLSDGTMIPPDVFVPLAEETGAIGFLGAWILRHACETAAAWRRDGVCDAPMAVNLSARQLDDPDLPRLVLATLVETGLPAAGLKLELTETARVQDEAQARDALAALRGAGIGLVMDDFGAGYASLAALRRLPMDMVKIDRSFVQAMVEDRDAGAIVHAVVALAHELGLGVVAEGVETPEQLLYLRAYRCDRIQGWLLSRPLAADAVPEFVRRGPSLPATGG